MKHTDREYYVQVFPVRPLGPATDKQWKQACIEIEAQIRRHVDYGRINMWWNSHESCSYCGRKWVEDGDNYNGGCCDEDEMNRPGATT